MRKCLRCGIEMVENGCPGAASGWPIAIAKDSLYGKKLGELCCAVCPKCGYVEFYIKDTEKKKKNDKRHLSCHWSSNGGSLWHGRRPSRRA